MTEIPASAAWHSDVRHVVWPRTAGLDRHQIQHPGPVCLGQAPARHLPAHAEREIAVAEGASGTGPDIAPSSMLSNIQAQCGKTARWARLAGRGNVVKVETETPALGRKPSATAIPSTLDKRASPRLYPKQKPVVLSDLWLHRRARPCPSPLDVQ